MSCDESYACINNVRNKLFGEEKAYRTCPECGYRWANPKGGCLNCVFRKHTEEAREREIQSEISRRFGIKIRDLLKPTNLPAVISTSVLITELKKIENEVRMDDR